MKPRIPPVSLEDADAPTRELFSQLRKETRKMNVFRTFAHHPDLMRPWLSGVLDADLERLTQGPDAEGWSIAEAAALRATDELIERHTLADAAWAGLTAHFTTQQILDLIFLFGQYQLVASALNALRVERDDRLGRRQVPEQALAGRPFPLTPRYRPPAPT